MEAPKRGRGRPPKISKNANGKQQGAGAGTGKAVVEPTGGEGGAASAADTGAKAPKKRGREPSTERYGSCMVN